MKRLLFCMATSSTIGGVETWLSRACPYLNERGFDPIVALAKGELYNDADKFKDQHRDLNTVILDGRGLDRYGRVQTIVRCIKRHRPEAVFPLGILDAYEATARTKADGYNTRLIARTQGNLPPMIADITSYRDWIDLCICPGRLALNTLVEWGGFDHQRMRHIPNGSDPPACTQVIKSTQAPIRIGFVGRLTPNDKRSLDLIPLYRELKARGLEFTLDIVGDGPCRDQIASAIGNEPEVRMHGSIPHDRVLSNVYPDLDVLVLLSSSESFGIALVEAQMHGVVPVTSEFVGIHSENLVLKNQTGLFFPVGDMAAAVQCITKFCEDRDLMEKYSESAAEHALHFTWDICLEKWALALDEAIHAAPVVPNSSIPRLAQPHKGRLTKLGVSGQMADRYRRLRRLLFGTSVPAGGVEWPLFNKQHPQETLNQISQTLHEVEERSRRRSDSYDVRSATEGSMSP